MLEIYDKKSGLKFPNGETWDVERIKADPTYSMLFDTDCVIEVVGGVTRSYTPLESLAEAYGIEMGDDPNETLEQIEAERKRQVEYNKNAPTVLEQAAADAKEAKSKADTTAASVNEYMDALLGLNTTDETEATDAE